MHTIARSRQYDIISFAEIDSKKWCSVPDPQNHKFHAIYLIEKSSFDREFYREIPIESLNLVLDWRGFEIFKKYPKINVFLIALTLSINKSCFF